VANSHVVIGDCHVKPGQDLSRFRVLGRYVVKKKPEVVVFLGDFADMPSLCSYDRGTRGFVGRRYHEDVNSVHEALALFMSPLNSYNKRRKDNKKKQYNPRLIMLGGNHDEARINRAIEADHVLEGTISIKDLHYDKHFEYYPYLDIVNVDGVNYTRS
jgi:predicted phosphodiesterase